MNERVAITGLGAVTPIGIGAEALAEALEAGRSGVRRITAFDCRGFDTQIAAEVDDTTIDPAEFVKPKKMAKHMTRATLFAVAAASLARRRAGLGPQDVDSDRLGVSLGAGGMGPVDLDILAGQAAAIIESARENGGCDFNVPSFARIYRARTNPISMLRGLPNLAAAHIAIQHDARGPNNTFTTACTSGTQAIGEGMRLIQRGDADVVLAGGADTMINPVGILGFSMLGTLSRRNHEPTAASRPFDRNRDGFVIGEGAAVVVLEREQFAKARGAPILAEAAGYGVTCDAFRITDERPDATGAARAMLNCVRSAAADFADIGYINAHGTGTPMNDLTETRAIKAVFGSRAYELPVSSTKSMIGHLLAAAGAVECAATVMAMIRGIIPPTINMETPDAECDLDYVPNSARSARFSAALSNSFGFGGQNACLLIRHW